MNFLTVQPIDVLMKVTLRWMLVACLLTMLMVTLGCETTPKRGDASGSTGGSTNATGDDTGATEPRPLDFDTVIREDDRILFVGDDITQQMFYTRATASALMAVRPRHKLWFFNGGRNGATAAEGGQWVDELMVLARPTVVFICLGFNDGREQPVTDDLKAAYRDGLSDVVRRAKGYAHVRRVIVLGPPATHHGVADERDILGDNVRLQALSDVAFEVARDNGADYIDLFDTMHSVYVAASRLAGAPVISASQLPTEQGHIVLASAILWGIGVTPRMIDPVGWSPLIPRKMGHVRGALAVARKPVLDLNQAQASRDLYEAMRRFDETFFRIWRLAQDDGPDPRRNRADLWVDARRQWVEIQAMAIQMYGRDGAGDGAAADSG